jgi:hypothetical protein
MTRRLPTLDELDQAHRDALAGLRGRHQQKATEARRVAMVHVRALRRSAGRLPWWRRVVFWAQVWGETR